MLYYVEHLNFVPTKEEIFESESLHMQQRRVRERLALTLDKGASLVDAFLVDKGHPDGEEMHVVSSAGIIYVLNYGKFMHHRHALITILIARPGQVRRLYEECGMYASRSILNVCREHQLANLNV